MKIIIEELTAAAFYFSKHPESTAADVGAFVGKGQRTILRWSQTAEWNTALDNLGFEGDRGWRRNVQRDIQRDDGDIVELAKICLSAASRGRASERGIGADCCPDGE